MFEKHKEKRAEEHYQAELAHWQAQRDGYAHLLETAKSYSGTPSDQLMLGAGEAVFYTVSGAALVEDRQGPGHWQGGSTGVSIPIGSLGGHAVRYRVGATRGHYVQGTPVPTAVDTGTLFITNKRVVFTGAKQTRECSFAKLVGFQHDDASGSTTFSVSNRQKATTVHYGPGVSASFDFMLDLALAHFKGTVADLVQQLEADVAHLEAARPSPPSALPS